MTEMTEARAREILGDRLRPNHSTKPPSEYIDSVCTMTANGVTRTSVQFYATADELEAIVFWMRKHAP